MQKLSLPVRACVAMMVAIMRLSSGLMIAQSRPLAITMVMKGWFIKLRYGTP